MRNGFKRILLLVLVAGIAGVGLFAWQAGSHQPAAAPTQPTSQSPAQPGSIPPATAPADPCSAVTATAASSGPGASGFPDEGFDNGDTTSTPSPANPVQKACEGGRIKIQVGAPREFGHRIGDVIPIRVLVLTDDSVLIDFTSLKSGVLGFNGNEFELAAENPVTIKVMSKEHQRLYVIDLKVQTFVNKDPGVVFNLDLRYATGLAADSKTPNWQVLTTPDFFVTRSATADNGDELLEGSLDAATSPSPWLVWPVLVSGFFLVLLWPGVIVVRLINRIRPGRRIPKEEVAWKRFRKAIADAKEYGWETRHYRLIASALRVYFEVAPRTPLEVQDRLKDHPKIDVITSALAKCDRVLFKNETLTADENKQLLRELDLLVPKPD